MQKNNKPYIYPPSIRDIELLLEKNDIVDRTTNQEYPVTFEVLSKIKKGTRDKIKSC